MLTVLDERTPVRRSQRKACRKGVKTELKSLSRAADDRARVRQSWIAAKCENCGRCPKLISKLAA